MLKVMRGMACAAALACALPATAMAAGGATVNSGPLRVSVAKGPWHLAVTDSRGRTVVSESTRAGANATGRLGFRVGSTWRHATRTLSVRRSGRAIAATVATNDPAHRTLAVTIAPSAQGSIRVTATPSQSAGVLASGIGFAMRRQEHFLGFGERSNAVDQRGNDVVSYVAEGPYNEADTKLVSHVLPPPGFAPRPEVSYFPMPWFVSTAGYGMLVRNAEPSTAHLGTQARDAWSVEADAATLEFQLFPGPHPADVVRRMSATVGRQPHLVAPTVLGPWYQAAPDDDDATGMAKLKAADAPASVGQTYTHYLPCGRQVGREAQEQALTAAYHAAGYAVTTYFNPMICESYTSAWSAAAAAGVLTKQANGSPYVYSYVGSRRFSVSQVDFSAPGATAFYGGLLQAAVGAGYDGWMEDFGEYTPLDSHSADGRSGAAEHNLYPALYHGAAWKFQQHTTRPLLRFIRSGWTGAARTAPVVWGGDPTTDWGYDGLASAVRNGLTMGLSGVSLWGSDTGGFFGLSVHLTPELLQRWIEVGFASGVMRTESSGSAPVGRPQIFDPAIMPIWRRYAKLRTQLFPYLSAAEAEYDRTGMPIMRQLSLLYPGDARVHSLEDEYAFGPDLLVAPVLHPGQTKRKLYLPRGQWVDAWRALDYDATNGSFHLGRAQAAPGARDVTVPAPIEQLPMFVRAGAVLPLLPADVDTLSAYGSAPGLVHASDREDRRTLIAFPRGTSRSALGAGESLTSTESARSWRLRVAGARSRTYDLQASLATLAHPFRPCTVTLGGRSLPSSAWTWSASTRVLRATFTARRGDLVVRGCAS